MSYKQILENTITRRSFLAGALQLGLTGMIAARAGYLQLVQREYYSTMSENNRITAIMVPPLRGNIFDRNGVLLASSSYNFNIMLDRRQATDINHVIARIANLLRLNVTQHQSLLAAAESNRRQKRIALLKNISWQQMATIEENLLDLPGIYIDDSENRYYHLPLKTAHIIGYVAALNAQEKEELAIVNTENFKIGKKGIEKYYDTLLRGEFGIKEAEVNAKGIIIRELASTPSKKGTDATLTIDVDLQHIAYSLLPPEGGSIVLIDVTNGEVLCSASTPSFDNNLLSGVITDAMWSKLQTQKGTPLVDKVTQSLYPPGSIFKIVTVLAALESGVSPDEIITCDGLPVLGGKSFRCWRKHGHGRINMENALKYSCNSYIFRIAKKIGYEKILDTAKKLGFGDCTGLDLPAENKGFLPTDTWKKKRFNQKWTLGDTLNLAIGQGFMLSTHIQLAQMMSIIANDGVRQHLHFMSSVFNNDPEERVHHYKVDILSEHFQFVKNALWKIVNEPGGTAYFSRITVPNLQFAGKTGTCQVQSKKGANIDLNTTKLREHRNHAVFTGYGPIPSPKFAISVIIDHGGGGGGTAAPIAKKILEYAFVKYCRDI